VWRRASRNEVYVVWESCVFILLLFGIWYATYKVHHRYDWLLDGVCVAGVKHMGSGVGVLECANIEKSLLGHYDHVHTQLKL